MPTLRRPPVPLPLCEPLEPRCLLSASVPAEVSIERHSHHEKMAPASLPHLEGQFFMITNTDHGRFTGILTLTQNGKHLQGTLANPGHPPGKFKAKIVIVNSSSQPLAAASTQVKLTGKMVDRLLKSIWARFKTDNFDPGAWPNPADAPQPLDSRIDGNWDDDDLPDLPPLPDFELHPVPK